MTAVCGLGCGPSGGLLSLVSGGSSSSRWCQRRRKSAQNSCAYGGVVVRMWGLVWFGAALPRVALASQQIGLGGQRCWQAARQVGVWIDAGRPGGRVDAVHADRTTSAGVGPAEGCGLRARRRCWRWAASSRARGAVRRSAGWDGRRCGRGCRTGRLPDRRRSSCMSMPSAELCRAALSSLGWRLRSGPAARHSFIVLSYSQYRGGVDDRERAFQRREVAAKGPSPDNRVSRLVVSERWYSSTRRGSLRVGC